MNKAKSNKQLKLPIPISLVKQSNREKRIKLPKPPALLKFSQSWLDKRKLKIDDLKINQITNDDLAPELNKGDFVMVDSANTSIVNGKYHAFVYDSEFYIKRLEVLANGDLMAITNKDKHLIKKSKSYMFCLLGVVVHKQGEL